MFGVDRIVRMSRIFRMTRTVDGRPSESIASVHAQTTLSMESTERSGETASDASAAAKAGIIADFRATMGELKCLGSERLVRLGISMSQLHVMHLLDRHGDIPMSRLAELVDVSLSNATGLIDRLEERGYVERIRVANDRRVVLVRITAAGRGVLNEVESGREGIFDRILDELDPGQLSRLAAALADLRSALTTTFASHARAHHSHEPQGRN
jgi:DNA-binding MarR family transcriptional regulator